MSLDSEDAGNAVFLGNRRIDMSGRKYKLRKTDECVEICRKQANRYKNENPCKWCECAICKGFVIV